MKIRLTNDLSGPGFYKAAGSIIDLPKGEAERFLAKGLAVKVARKSTEKAVEAPVETATLEG